MQEQGLTADNPIEIVSTQTWGIRLAQPDENNVCWSPDTGLFYKVRFVQVPALTAQQEDRIRELIAEALKEALA